ncbi:energy transducer TonB [Segatella copri]|jgi:TonB family protein|uniref:Energy transducer TonB n=1 Tax=Segatella copri TaxID=165179 RepID=A0AAW5USU5_9BACT|nr:energy transducer TonB [Segatella copri]MCW4111957.1 energy transducer TonB [Segatella copri]MCW4122145.1 energy transducer TonB [Segatella copri]MCW4155914.1 energy transducer TonB [Segatella copri]
MKHSFLQTLSTTFSSKIGKSIILAIFVMLTGSPTFGQARRGTTQKAHTTTVTKPSPNLVNDFNKKIKNHYFFNNKSNKNEWDIVFKPANTEGKGGGNIVIPISKHGLSFSYNITANGSIYIKIDNVKMKEEKITWQTNPDGVILEDLFFQLQSDSLKYDELVNWNQNEEPEVFPTINYYEAQEFDTVDEKPSFPGGESAMKSFLRSNIKYPIVAQENGDQGCVFVQFIIEKDGSISDVKVARSDAPSLDKEAMRVVKAMPKWNPGKLKGIPVRVKNEVPVVFRL